MSGIKIAKELGLTVDKTYAILKENNVNMRTTKETSRKYVVDNSYFSCIDSENKAYWLGFLYADGAVMIHKSGQHVLKLDLHQKDHNHLVKFAEDLRCSTPLKQFNQKTTYGSTSVSRLLITSDQLVEDLITLGCVTNKTFVLQPPKIDELFYRHFIRGYVDGDGSISKHNGCADRYRLKISGVEPILSWINSQFPRAGSIYPMKTVYSLETHADNIVWLYNDANIYLERKYERYRHILELRKSR